MKENSINVKFPKGVSNSIQNYQYVKKLYLDNRKNGTRILENAINDSIKIKKLKKFFNENLLFKITDNVEMRIIKIKYLIKKEQIEIIEGVILFLSNNEDALNEITKAFN